MENKNIEELTEILKRLNNEGVTEDLKREATEIVSKISATELSKAEQNLIDDGMNPQDLRNLCVIHMEVLKDELNKIKSQLHEGHIIDILMKEHEKLLEILDTLEDTNLKMQKMDKYDPNAEEFKILLNLADDLLEIDKHNDKEEQVLFSELENRGITGPTRIMRMEHSDLAIREKQLKNIAEFTAQLDFKTFKETLDEVSKYIVFNLRDHIFKENYILYPSALESITDKDIWEDIKNRCDKIGYCRFI